MAITLFLETWTCHQEPVRVHPKIVPSQFLTSLSSDALGSNQACTFFGAQDGGDIIRRHNYLDAGYGIMMTDIWRCCFLALIGFFIAFQVTQIVAFEYFP
ncbi:hypothetical protein PM082_010140 [Marasmius tenuissimus]|nr:hypothetical protein PM082_010140 [Marasmius tenuissimus]